MPCPAIAPPPAATRARFGRPCLLIGAALALAGCAGAPPSPAPEAATAPPFTAAEIREASAPGRTYVQRLTPVGEQPMTVTVRFAEVDAAGATLEIRTADIPTPDRARLTWAEFERHGVPAPGAVRTEAPCAVPAGAFRCVVFTAEGEAGRIRSSFARALPGMPVRVEQEVDGRWVTTMVVERHLPGDRR